MQKILTSKFINSVIDIILNTKEVIKNCKKPEINKKGQGNFVTEVDLKVQKSLVEALLKLLPESGIIAEESLDNKGKIYNWIIDPIDGTTNFLNDYSYAVSLALQYKNENILGTIFNPINNHLFIGVKEKGSYLIIDKYIEKLEVKKFPKDEGIILIGMPYDRKKTHQILSIAEKLYEMASDIKRIGPASIDICRVAQNKAKLYCELDLNVWDTAAGEVILIEAGGTVEKVENLSLFGSTEVIEQALSLLQ